MISTSPVISRHDETVSWRRQFLKDVIQGLKRPQKEVACKYFYDEIGSALFDEICDQLIALVRDHIGPAALRKNPS